MPCRDIDPLLDFDSEIERSPLFQRRELRQQLKELRDDLVEIQLTIEGVGESQHVKCIFRMIFSTFYNDMQCNYFAIMSL